jgi:hypothetical protein
MGDRQGAGVFNTMSNAALVEDALWTVLRAAASSSTSWAPALESHPPSAEWVLRGVADRLRGQQMEAMGQAGFKALGWPWPAELTTHGARGRAVLLQSTRLDVSDQLKRRGIPHVFFKGALTDPLWWGGRGLRGGLDVDVLVSPRDFKGAREALVSGGFHEEIPAGHPVTTRVSKERTLVRGPAAVDLHRRLLNSPPFHDDPDGVLRRAVEHATASGAIWGPCLEDVLVLSAGNLAGDRFLPRVKLGLDAWAAVIGGADVGVAAERARTWGCAWSFWALAALLQGRLNAPSMVSNAPPPPRWLQPWLRHLAVQAPLRIPGPLPQLLFQAWPLSERLGWPLHQSARWLALRTADLAVQTSRHSQ